MVTKLADILLKDKYLTVFLLLMLASQSNAQILKPSIQDSFDRVILKETDDSTKIRHIIRYLLGYNSKDSENLLKYFDRGKRLGESLNNKSLLHQVYLVTAGRLEKIGNVDRAEEMYQNLISLQSDDKNNTPQAYSETHIHLGQLYINKGNSAAALNKLNTAIKTLKTAGLDSLLTFAYDEMSITFRNTGELDQALAYSDSALIASQKIADNILTASVYSNRGRIFRKKGMTKEAKECYLISEENYLKDNQVEKLAVIYNNLGNIDHILGNYNEAIAYYVKSLEIKEKENNRKGISISYHNIGAIKFDMKDWDKALKDFNKSNEIAKEISFKGLEIHNAQKIGLVHYEKGDYNKALEHHTIAYKASKEINFSTGLMAGLNNLGRDNIALQNYSEASFQLFEGLTIAEKTGAKPMEADLLISIAQLYIELEENNDQSVPLDLESRSIRNEGIEDLLLRANTLADEMGQAENKLKALKSLHYYYSKNRNHNKDSYILGKLVELQDSLFSSERLDALADWETKYETAEKEKEIIALESEKKIEIFKRKQIRSLLYLSLGFFCLLFWLGYIYLSQRNQRLQLQSRELFRTKLSSNLHDDVGSILTGLAMQSELLSNFADDNMKQSIDKIAAMSRDAMSRMRDTVWAIDSRKDSYADLVDRMLDFGEDVLVPKNIQLKLDNQIEDKKSGILPEIRQNVYLIFKEAISNISKYSTADIVNVSLSLADNLLKLSIHDNGIVVAKNVKTSGTGTSNIYGRAKNLGGKAVIDYGNFGYHVDVQIPVSKVN